MTTSSGSTPPQEDVTYSKSNTLEEYQIHHQKLQLHYQQQLQAQRKQLQHHHQVQLQQQQLLQKHFNSDTGARLVCGAYHQVNSNTSSGFIQHECQNYNCTVSHSQWIQQQQENKSLYQNDAKQANRLKSGDDLQSDAANLSNESLSLHNGARPILINHTTNLSRTNQAKPGHHSHCINCALQVQQEQR